MTQLKTVIDHDSEPGALDQWEQNPTAATDEWKRRGGARDYCVVSQYSGSDDYCWQVAHGDDRLAGIKRGRLAAMIQAEEVLALPIEEFNRRVVAELLEDFHKTEIKILRLSPSTDLMPGYHAGYEAGVADVKRRIEAAIDFHEAGQS